MDLVIFHYHFLTGGVTTVVTRAIEAFRRYLPGIGKITLVAGRIPLEPSWLKSLAVEVHQLPEIDYLDANALSDPAGDSGKLAGLLLGLFSSTESIWWVHNFHLGKNPLFTEALLEIAENSAQRMILQIHDFPESGRYLNLLTLSRFLNRDFVNRGFINHGFINRPLYPQVPNVHYAVLNQRDYDLLRKVGLSRVSLLENPVSPYLPEREGTPAEKAVLKKKLSTLFGRVFPRYDPGKPLLLYPVRAIRRKNALESALIAELSPGRVNLVISLPGLSSTEKQYSNLVEAQYRLGRIRGLWAIGAANTLPFEDLIGASDLILSTSVQEGFGYLFINALQWRLPLLARDLDILEGLKPMFSDYPAHFYRELRVSLSRDLRQKLSGTYRRKIENLQKQFPEKIFSRQDLSFLTDTMQRFFEQDPVEFSYLPAREQESVLESLESTARREELRDLNGPLLEALEKLLETEPPDKSGPVEERFGFKAFAHAFQRLCSQTGSPLPSGRFSQERDIQTQILRYFLKKEYLRLLYD